MQRVLVTVTGADQPGITAALSHTLSQSEAVLLDIEQVVVQGQLTLCLLVGIEEGSGQGEPVLKDLLFTAKRFGLELHFRVLEERLTRIEPHTRALYAVTAIGDVLDGQALHCLASTLSRHNANIESIRRLSDGGLSSIEILIALPDKNRAPVLRKELMEATAKLGFDVAVQRETLTRRSKRLVVMDMDSTLIRMEVIDELARLFGVGEKVAEITRQAMAGHLNFEQSLTQRVGLLKGLEEECLMKLAQDLPLTEGAEDLLCVLRKLGYKTAVISGGFTFAAQSLKQRLHLDYAYANQLEIRDGKLTGKVLEPVLGAQRKADLLDAIAQGEGISIDQTIAIGDGANDLPMLERAGLGIAFHAKPKLKAAADTAISAGGLDRILYLLGLHARDVQELLQNSR